MFINEIAQEIETLEGKILDFNDKLDFVFQTSLPDDDGAMETVMSLAEKITHLEKKKEKLEQTFWSLI